MNQLIRGGFLKTISNISSINILLCNSVYWDSATVKVHNIPISFLKANSGGGNHYIETTFIYDMPTLFVNGAIVFQEPRLFKFEIDIQPSLIFNSKNNFIDLVEYRRVNLNLK